MLSKDMRDLLSVFDRHGVEYLIVGGYAYGVHAEPRATKDLDLFIQTSAENALAVFKALAEYGAPMGDLSPADFADGSTFQIGQPPNRIDVLQKIDGISFDEAWAHHVEGLIDGEFKANVISRGDLIRNKLASGRLQDMADVENLRSAQDL